MPFEIKMIFEVTSMHFRETLSADQTLKSLMNVKRLDKHVNFKCQHDV